MKLQPGLVFAGLLALGLSTYSCANGDTVSGSSGSGGDNGSGSGGSSSGGSTGSGGSQNKGGSTGSGGTAVSSGGTTGSGGAKGGSTGSGGAKGGTTGSGGTVVSSGGTTGSGGSVSTGSGGSVSTGSGGSSSSGCTPSFSVTPAGFVTMPAVGGGCWSGFASDGGDAGSTIMPGTFSSCSSPCMLTMTGTLNASVSPDYAGYSYLGFNVGQSNSGGTAAAVVPQGSGITVTYTNTGNSPVVRVALNADATGTTSWCAAVTASPATLKYSAFTQQCYNATPGPAYMKQGIVSVQLSVPGGAAKAPVNITLVSVVENP